MEAVKWARENQTSGAQSGEREEGAILFAEVRTGEAEVEAVRITVRGALYVRERLGTW